MNERDKIGMYGEAFFQTQMTKFDVPSGPLFRPHFLGEKWPLIDFYVECEEAGDAAPFFFVQVKATHGIYTKTGRLKVNIDAVTARTLSAHPAPTYVVGIDIDNDRGYIASANGVLTRGISSIAPSGIIDAVNRRLLWNEVVGYWRGQSAYSLVSSFRDANWR